MTDPSTSGRVAGNPAAPWLTQAQWRDGKVRDGGDRDVLAAWGVVLLFAGLLAGLGAAYRHQPFALKDIRAIAAAALMLGTAGTLFHAMRVTVRRLRFGRSVLEMVTFPGVIGGQLVGMVTTKVKLQTEEGFRVKLACLIRPWEGRGKNERSTARTIWSEQQHLVRGALEEDGTRSVIPIGFRIPPTCRETSARANSDQILWKLTVSAKVPGVDYEATFEVPVYITPDSNAPESSVDVVAAYKAPIAPPTGTRGRGVKCWNDACGKLHVEVARARNLRAAGVLSILTISLALATRFLWIQPMPDLFSRLVMETLVTGFGAATLLFSVFLVSALAIKKETIADRQEVAVTTWLGLLPLVQRPLPQEVLSVQLSRSMSMGERQWFRVALRVPWQKARGVISERSITLGTNLEKEDAEWIAAQLRIVLGVASG